jgi:hypothetical protein
MSLSLLTFGLLCARSAQAQTPGHWEFDHYGCQGVDTGSGGRFMGGPWSFPWASTQTVNLTGIAYGDADWSNITVTLTPFFRWVPGSNPSAPPSILYAKITSAAYAGDENGGSVSADNGFGDVSNQPPPGYYSIGASSVGSHLEHKDPQGQTLVSLPPQTLSASGGRANDWQSISSQVEYQAVTDNRNRAVTITSSIDATNYKQADPNSPTDGNGDPNYIGVPHAREANGTMRGDVGLSITGPNDFTNITYHANLTGNWQTPGSYNWFSSLKQVSDNGSLYPPDFTNVYAKPWWVDSDTPGVPPHVYLCEADPSKPDHIHITCTDGGDGATASADYYMTLHPAEEQNYPDHMMRGIENVRQAPSTIYGRSTQDGSTVAVYAENASTWGVAATTDGPFGDFIAGILGVNLSVSYSYTYNAGVQCSLPSVKAGYGTYMEFFDAYKYHTGKVDQWGMGGYIGTAPYHVKEPDSPSGGIQAHYPPIALP